MCKYFFPMHFSLFEQEIYSHIFLQHPVNNMVTDMVKIDAFECECTGCEILIVYCEFTV